MTLFPIKVTASLGQRSQHKLSWNNCTCKWFHILQLEKDSLGDLYKISSMVYTIACDMDSCGDVH